MAGLNVKGAAKRPIVGSKSAGKLGKGAPRKKV